MNALTLTDLGNLPVTKLFEEHLWREGELEGERCLEMRVDGHPVLVSYVMMANGELLHYDVLDTGFREPVLRTVRYRLAQYFGDE